MPANWLIIDGNNLLHYDPRLAGLARRDFDRARRELVQGLDQLAGRLARRVTIVFDGVGPGPGVGYDASAVEVVFSSTNLTADSVIERLARGAADRSSVTVVSSDRGERDSVEAGGVHSISCRTFLEWIDEARRRLAREVHGVRASAKKPTLGDSFPTGG